MTTRQDVVVRTLETARFGEVRLKVRQLHDRQDIFIAMKTFPVKLPETKKGKKSDIVTKGSIFLSYGNGKLPKGFQYHPAGIVGAIRKLKTILWQYDQEENLLHSVDLAVKDTATELRLWKFMSDRERTELDKFLVDISSTVVPHPELHYDEDKERAAERMQNGVKDKINRPNPTATTSKLHGAVNDLDRRQRRIKNIRPYMALRAEVLENEQDRILRDVKDLLLFLKASLSSSMLKGRQTGERYKREIGGFSKRLHDRMPDVTILANPFSKTLTDIYDQVPGLISYLHQRKFAKSRRKIEHWIAQIELFDYLGLASQLVYLLGTTGSPKFNKDPKLYEICIKQVKQCWSNLGDSDLVIAHSLRARFWEAQVFLISGEITKARESLQQVELTFC
ncbi:hypothetical protein ACFL1U_00250 [Patescibacteria group bacterium]